MKPVAIPGKADSNPLNAAPVPQVPQDAERPLDVIAEKMEPCRTIVYKAVRSRSLSLHIFEPPGHSTTNRTPAFVTFHGGSWTSRTPRCFYPFVDHFAALGLVSISVEYRLLDEQAGWTVFDCARDARSAIRYLRAHAPELGIDPKRIVVSGGSAGAHLAAGTALFDGMDEEGEDTSVSCRPDLLVLYYPVIDTSEAGYGQSKIGERWRELSPVDHVRPGLPPTLVLHGTGDTVTPFAGTARFHRLMKEAGNDCELIAFEGGRHGYFIFDLSLFAQAMTQTEEFLVKHGLPVDRRRLSIRGMGDVH